MRILTLVRVALFFCLPGIVGCGGDETVQGPQDQPAETTEEERLDFSSIEGVWNGTATDGGGNFSIRASLEGSAIPGRQVGSVRYWFPGASDYDCSGSWLAKQADHPSYRVEELITGGELDCPDGTVRLTLQDSGTLSYEFSPKGGSPAATFATGTLTGGQ